MKALKQDWKSKQIIQALLRKGILRKKLDIAFIVKGIWLQKLEEVKKLPLLGHDGNIQAPLVGEINQHVPEMISLPKVCDICDIVKVISHI